MSSQDQKTVRQEVKARELNIPIENVFIEKGSGKTLSNRPVLKNLIGLLKLHDTLIVDSISRFARNTKDLLSLVDQLNNKGVNFISLKENIDTTTPTGVFMLTIFGAVAQLERDYLLERQAEGIAAAKKQGKYKGRKKIEYPKNWVKYYHMYANNIIQASEAMKLLGLKKTTFYKLVKKHKESNNF